MSRPSENGTTVEVNSSAFAGNAIRHREASKAREAYAKGNTWPRSHTKTLAVNHELVFSLPLKTGDIEMSREIHEKKVIVPHEDEKHHGEAGKYLKSMILGG